MQDMTLTSDLVPAFLIEYGEDTPCKGSIVHTPDGYGRAYTDEVEAARAICRECPLLNECAEWAINRPSLIGVWGATTPRERKDIRRRRREGS